MTDFEEEAISRIDAMSRNERLHADAAEFMRTSLLAQYSYNFAWMSRPIIQYPQDMIAMQELIWRVRPDLIIETGIAHGGSLIFSASMLALLDMADAIESGVTLDPAKSNRKVLGIDIDIRAHNRAAIEAHPMASRIQMIQGSSIAPEVVTQVCEIAADYQRVLVSGQQLHPHPFRPSLVFGPVFIAGCLRIRRPDRSNAQVR